MPDKKRKILAKEWIAKSMDDYKSAKVVLEEGGYYGTTCFLSQQIAEKCLKGFLVFHDKKIKKIHDLVKLLNECKEIEKDIDKLEDECILLNDYYIETRYPLDSPIDYSKNEAKQALKAVEKIMNYVLEKVD